MSRYNQTSSFVIPRDSVQHISDSVQQILQKEYHVQAVLSPIQTPWRKKRKEVAITLRALSHWPQFRDAKKYLKLKLPSAETPPTPPHILIQRESWPEEPVEIAPRSCRRQMRRGGKYSTEVTASCGLESEAIVVNNRSCTKRNTSKDNLPSKLTPKEYIAKHNDEILKVFQETPKSPNSEMTTPTRPDVSESIMKKFDPRMQSPALSIEVLNVNKKISDMFDSSPTNIMTGIRLLERNSGAKRKSSELCSSGSAVNQRKKPRLSIERVSSKEKRKVKLMSSRKLRSVKHRKVTNRKKELLKNKKGFSVTLPNCIDAPQDIPDVIDISDEEMDTDKVINDTGQKDRTSNRGENFSFTLEGGKKSGDNSAEFTFKLATKDLENNLGCNSRPFRFSVGSKSSVINMSENRNCEANSHKLDMVASENSDIHFISPRTSEELEIMNIEDSDIFIVSPGDTSKDNKLESDDFDVHIISPEASKNIRLSSEGSDIHVPSEEPEIQYVHDGDVIGSGNEVSSSICSQFSKRKNEISSAADYIEIVKIIPHQNASEVAQIETLTPEKNLFMNNSNKKSEKQKFLNTRTHSIKTIQQSPGVKVSNFHFQAPTSVLPLSVGSHVPTSVPQTEDLFRKSVFPAFRFSLPDKPSQGYTSSVTHSIFPLSQTSSRIWHPSAETGSSRILGLTSAADKSTREKTPQLGLYGNNIYTPECIHVGARDGLRPVVIDGSNVAMAHGKHSVFSCRGIAICVDYFLKRGHKEVHAFVPQFRRKSGQAVDSHLLEKLERTGHVIFTPSRTLQKRTITCYDDRFIVQYAASCGGVIVSRDNFRDLLQEDQSWRETIEKRLLMYTWVGDTLMFPQDPLGRHGPKLDEFLSFSDK